MKRGRGECSRKEICFNIGDHKTTANIVARRAFTVVPADAVHVVEADYLGITKCYKVDKAAASGMSFTKSEFLDAPMIEEFPLPWSAGSPTSRAMGMAPGSWGAW